MDRVKMEFDKEAFKKYDAWMLRPEVLVERYGKINFATVKFFLEDGTEYSPMGGGPENYINVSHVYAYKNTVVEFDADCFFPDPWIMLHRVVFVEFELHK